MLWAGRGKGVRGGEGYVMRRAAHVKAGEGYGCTKSRDLHSVDGALGGQWGTRNAAPTQAWIGWHKWRLAACKAQHHRGFVRRDIPRASIKP